MQDPAQLCCSSSEVAAAAVRRWCYPDDWLKRVFEQSSKSLERHVLEEERERVNANENEGSCV